MRQRFIRNVGGTLRFVPPECRLLGVPSSPTITIKSALGGDLPTPVSGASATVESVALNVAEAASAGARQLSLADPPGPVQAGNVPTVGHRYLLECSDGERQIVRVLSYDSDTMTVYLSSPLPRDIDAAAVFYGIELSYALSGAQAQSPTSYSGYPYSSGPTPGPKGVNLQLFRAAWRYMIDGAEYDADQLFEINARLVKSSLEPDELAPHLPDAIDHLVPLNDSSQMYETIENAWQEILDDVANRGVKPDQIMDPERLRLPHLYRTLWMLSESWGGDWKEWRKEKFDLSVSKLEAALNAGDWIDLSDDAVQEEGETVYPLSVTLQR